jgi:hypothetical protein
MAWSTVAPPHTGNQIDNDNVNNSNAIQQRMHMSQHQLMNAAAAAAAAAGVVGDGGGLGSLVGYSQLANVKFEYVFITN